MKADLRHQGCVVEFFHTSNTRHGRNGPVRGRFTYSMNNKQIDFYNEREMERVLRSLASPRGKIR
jgi:hypothetical protein